MQQGSRGGSWKSPPPHQGFVHGVTCRLGAPNGSGSPRMCPVAAPQLSFPSSLCFWRVFPPPSTQSGGSVLFFLLHFHRGSNGNNPSSAKRLLRVPVGSPKTSPSQNPGSKGDRAESGEQKGTGTGDRNTGGTPKRGSSKGQSLGRWAGWQSPAGSGEVPRASSGTEIHPCFLFFFPVLFKLGHFLNPDLQDDHTNKR